MSTREVLEKALSALVDRGWTQGEYVDDKGRVCMEGALMDAATGLSVLVEEDAWRALAAVVGQALVPWNDEPGRTEDEVLAAFKDAIVACPLEEV